MKIRVGLYWYDGIFIFLFFYLFILQVQAIWPFTVDDMYISLRYAKNWVASGKILWNLADPPVEGYSNFIFVVFGALTVMLKGNPVLILKIAGLFGLFFTCCFLFLITRFWFAKRESLLPCLALLFYKGQIIWAVSGLETTVYEAFICGAVYFCLRGMGYRLYPQSRFKTQNSFFVFSGLLLAFSGLTRPEAPALMLLLFVLMCWDRPNLHQEELQNYWKGVTLFCLTVVLAYGPYFFWRFLYFGFLFPNSVYCKGLSEEFTLKLDMNYLKLIAPFVVLVLPACIHALDKRHYFLWLPSLIYLLMLANSDPVVAFDNRLFLPAFVLFLPLVLQGINILRKKTHSALLYFICIALTFLFIPSMSLADYHYFSQNPLQGERLRGKVLNWLNTHATPGGTVVLADSGMVPYMSTLNFIDSYCLNNLKMAHYPVNGRYKRFCKEILPKRPDIIILTSLIKQGRVMYTPIDACLRGLLDKQNGSQRQQNYYKLSKRFESHTPDSIYRYELFRLS